MNVPVLRAAHDDVVHELREAGALSPAAARPLDAMPGIDPRAVLAVAARGVVREAELGRY